MKFQECILKFRVLCVLIFLACNLTAYSQLSEFQVSVAATDETCTGNGTITVNVQNQTSGSTITYYLYLLPDLSQPLFQFTTSSISGLVSGDYRLVAEQKLGEQTNTASADFSIANQTIPLEFTVSDETVNNCMGNSGILTVDVTSGRAPYFYEIFSGPVVRPLQASNTFTGLPSGQYIIRVIDDCMTGRSLTYTLQLGSTNLSISGTVSTSATSCTSIEVSNTVLPAGGASLIYPLEVTYIIHPASGPDEIITSTFTTGDPDSLELSLTLPINGIETYTYDVIITDSCGQNFSLPDNVVDPKPTVALNDNPNTCGDKYLTLSIGNFSPPFTVAFTDFPDDFDPNDYHATPNGPFSNMLIEYGSETNTVPFGSYTVVILDNCGRSASATLEVIKEEIEVFPSTSNATCLNPNGAISIVLPFDRKIISAIIIDAPADYTPGFPNDVSSLITDGILTVTNIPSGEYAFTLIDDCGDTITPVEAEIKAFESRPPTFVSGQYCEQGRASLRVRNPNARLVTLLVTAGPPEFSDSYPVTVNDVNPSRNYYDFQDIPPGTYSFEITDACNITQLLENVPVVGYDPGSNNFVLSRNCGSFDLRVTDNSNKTGTYWLQRLNQATGNWEHPITSAPYQEGNAPNTTTAIQMNNNQLLVNLTFTGEFRILKTFSPVNDAADLCIETLGTFNFSGKLDLIGAYSLDCTGGSGPSSVYLEVEGREPFLFRIVTKDGAPFVVENGDNNIFTGLLPGLYEFQIEDGCGNLEPATVNIGTLLPLARAIAPAPPTLLKCVEEISPSGTNFDLTEMQSQILGGQNPALYDVTYHLSQAEADTGLNPIPNPNSFHYVGTDLPIYVRVEHKTIDLCHATTMFTIYVREIPALPIPEPPALCDGIPTYLTAPPGFDRYVWSTGDDSRQIRVEQPGNYTLTVRNYTGGLYCESAEVVYNVDLSGAATSVETTVTEWTESQNSITVHAQGPGEYVYSLDGGAFQSDNVFADLPSGLYNLEVKDLNECGSVFKQVLVFNYPKFFTPNGDGINDLWHIRYVQLEPGMDIMIYDRYGKFLKQLTSESSGWDGTYNGQPLPSTDYWFVLKRGNDEVVRGHFAMKR